MTCNFRGIKINILEPNEFNEEGEAAWDTLNLILFNLVQNSVKYNS